MVVQPLLQAHGSVWEGTIGECVHMGIQGNCGQFEGSCEAQGPGRDGGAGEVTSAKVQREE